MIKVFCNYHWYVVFAVIASAPNIAQAGWKLSFSDDFHSGALNRNVWAATFINADQTLPGNGELECYLDSNVTSNSKALFLTAKREPAPCTRPKLVMEYSSGMISSHKSFAQTYGYFEIKTKLPSGKGLWPAFWLLPKTGAWPPEIDVFEVLGDNMKRAYMTLHWQENGAQKSNTTFEDGPDLSQDFHRFGVDWQPGLLVWYIDGIEQKRMSNASVPSEPMYMLANLAVGGHWPGNPDGSYAFPKAMEIAYIHVYERVHDGKSDTLPPGALDKAPPAAKVAPLIPQSGINLLRNPNLELDLANWTPNTQQISLIPSAILGFKAVQIVGQGGIEQVITGLAPNTTYVLWAYARSLKGDPVMIGAKGGGNGLAQTTKSNFEKLVSSFTTDAKAAPVTIFAWQQSGTGQAGAFLLAPLAKASNTP